MSEIDQINENPGIDQETTIKESTLRTNTEQLPEDINTEKNIQNVEPYIQPAEPPQGLPDNKSEEVATPGDEEAPESDRARIERLGRERPARFKSFEAELAFCYSVIASQFMSVRFVPVRLSKAES